MQNADKRQKTYLRRQIWFSSFTSPALALKMIRRIAPGHAFVPGFAIGAQACPADDVAAGQVAHSAFFGRADILQRNLTLLLLIVQDINRLQAATRQIARHHSNLPGGEERNLSSSVLGPLAMHESLLKT